MEIYLVYEKFFNELAKELGESTQILGVFKDLDKATKKAKEILNKDLEEDWVLDEQAENNTDENGGIWRVFYGTQENWDCYYEMIIEKIEVE